MSQNVYEKSQVCRCDSPTCKQAQPLTGSDYRNSIHYVTRRDTLNSLHTGLNYRLHHAVRKNKRRILTGCCGVVLSIIALIVYLVDPVELLISWQTSVVEGTVVYHFWKKPPVNVLLNVYLFNVTNPEEFLQGHEKLRLQEVGPFVYRELFENNNPIFNENGTITFKPNRTLVLEREMSAGNPAQTYLTLPNIPYLGAVSMLHSASFLTNVGLRSLTAYLNSQPFVNLSVHDILTGYDDPLVRLGNTALPSFVGFKRFGVLDRMYSEPEGGDIVSMKAGPNPGLNPEDPDKWLHDVFSLDTYNGSPGMAQWGYGETLVHDPHTNSSKPFEKPCLMVRGSLEGFMFPRRITSENKFFVYRRAFCRTFPALYDHEGIGPGGYRALWFKLDSEAMNPYNEMNSCYCKKEEGPCLPKGTVDVSPCYYSMPLSLSMPHFLHGEPRLSEAIDGLSPNPDYESYLIVQPELGVPLSIRCKIQMNLQMKKNRLHPKTAPFSDLTVPILWIDFSVKDLPSDIETIMTMALYVGPILQIAFIALLVLAGTILLLLAAFRSQKQPFYDTVNIDPCRKQSYIEAVND